MIGLIGGTMMLVGVALIVLPVPAFLVIPAGLAVLATEFAWAKRWLHKIKEMVQRNKPGEQSGTQASDTKPSEHREVVGSNDERP